MAARIDLTAIAIGLLGFVITVGGSAVAVACACANGWL